MSVSLEVKSTLKLLQELSTPEKKKRAETFFKLGKGQYGYGDVFIGVRVPEVRQIAIQSRSLSLQALDKLIHSRFHEARLLALLIGIEKLKVKLWNSQQAFEFYTRHFQNINNWDLVDLSAPSLLGPYLGELGVKKRWDYLSKWARTEHMWTRRSSIVCLLYFIKNKRTREVFQLAPLLMGDGQDLMHKATGWLLREAGKVHPAPLQSFINKYGNQMPRTMLRYAIERWPETKRKKTLRETRMRALS